MDANLAAVRATQDAVILGRRSYTEWAQFWPSSQIEPFATFINGVTKYVATSTPLDQDWTNTTAIDGGLVEFVRDLKSSAEASDPCRQADRQEVKPPIGVEAASWSAAGELDYWVRDRYEWWGWVRGPDGHQLWLRAAELRQAPG